MAFIPGITPSSTPTGSGATLATLVDRLADELGFFQRIVTTATPVGGDPSRVVLADELRDDEAGYEFLGAPWLYVHSGDYAGTQRRMVREPEAGYQGEIGAARVSRPLPATLGSNVTLKFTNPLPVTRSLGVKGLVECLNEGLSYVQVPARITFTGSGTRTNSLASYPWLTDEAQTMGVWDSYGLSAIEPLERASLDYRFVSNGVERSLITARSYTSSETFQLGVIVPADRLIYDGSAWSYKPDGSTGLQSDTDQTAAPPRHALVFGMIQALKYLRRYLMLRTDLDPEIKAALMTDTRERLHTWSVAGARLMRTAFPRPAQGQAPYMFGLSSDEEWI